MENKDYYDILGVSKEADDQELKQAYRRLARQYHPDFNPDSTAAEENFKDINEAYEILSNPDKRLLYDQHGDNWTQWQAQEGPNDFWGDWIGFAAEAAQQQQQKERPRAHSYTEEFERLRNASKAAKQEAAPPSNSSGEPSFSDFFQQLFSGASEPPSKRKSGVRISTGESSSSSSKRPSASPQSGPSPHVASTVSSAPPRSASTVSSAGPPRSAPTPPSNFTSNRSSVGRSYSGSMPNAGAYASTRSLQGQNYEQPVEITLEEAYMGTTRVFQLGEQRLEVNIPAGSDNGTCVRVAGKGGPGFAGGPSGDLFLIIEVLPDARFKRVGNNLETHVAVNLYTAMLGGEVQVPIPGGHFCMLRVPAETQNGQKFCLHNQGMPVLNHLQERGELYAIVDIKLPRKLSDPERQLFEELRRLRPLIG